MSEHIARTIFKNTPYQASEEDIEKLSKNICLLKQRGLDKLNQRLIEGGRGIWDTIVEHNFATNLCLLHNPSVSISYEPNELQRPPDFKVVIDDTTFWIQVKNLSESERMNRQDKMFDKIKIAVSNIKAGKFFSCDLSTEFTENDIIPLKNFIADAQRENVENKDYFFPSAEKPKAKIMFWLPKNKELFCLTLGAAGDMDMVEVTGHAEEQIKQSLINAVGAFDWKTNDSTINLALLQADRYHDVDICNAIFGTEYESFTTRGQHTWGRKSDGLFMEQEFCNKISGVIGVRRKGRERKPICCSQSILYVNHRFKDNVDKMNRLLSFDKIVYYNMRPPMGQGNFPTI